MQYGVAVLKRDIAVAHRLQNRHAIIAEFSNRSSISAYQAICRARRRPRTRKDIHAEIRLGGTGEKHCWNAVNVT